MKGSNTTKRSNTRSHNQVSRRTLLRASATAGLAGIAGLPFASIAPAQSRTLKIGYIGSLSGARADFGQSDLWVIDRVKKAVRDGLKIGPTTYAVEIIVRDDQTDPNRANVIANELILREQCDLILTCDGENTAGGTAALADAKGTPLISTQVPWQAWMFARHGRPDQGFPYTFHFFWGADDLYNVFTSTWSRVKTNRTVGTLYVDQIGARAFADPKFGLPAFINKAGFKLVDGGFFQMGTPDFSNQLSTFKKAEADILSGALFINDFTNLWNQAAQMGYRPQICAVAGSVTFPSAIDALGDRGNGMSGDYIWGPAFPYSSSLTGESAKQLVAAWEATTNKQWTSPIGYAHAVWEVGFAALKNSGDPKNKKAVRDAIANLAIDTIVGPVRFKNSPVKNVALMKLCGGQWLKTKSGPYRYETAVVDNSLMPDVPIERPFKLLSELS